MQFSGWWICHHRFYLFPWCSTYSCHSRSLGWKKELQNVHSTWCCSYFIGGIKCSCIISVLQTGFSYVFKMGVPKNCQLSLEFGDGDQFPTQNRVFFNILKCVFTFCFHFLFSSPCPHILLLFFLIASIFYRSAMFQHWQKQQYMSLLLTNTVTS